MSAGPQFVPPAETRERNWLPLAVAAAVVVVIAAVAVLVLQHGKSAAKATPISAAPDPYAVNLPLTNLAMSESGNLAGGKLTYVDGHIANKGARVVSGVTVQVLFRNFAHEIVQNDTQSLKIIRMREPYIDVQPVSASPLQPGAQQDFRLIFDAVSSEWDGAYPELRIVRVETR